MKHVRLCTLAAVAATVLMAFAASASATVIKREGIRTEAGASGSASASGSIILKTGGGTTLATCTAGNVAGSITNAGGASATVAGSISGLSWSSCNTTVDTLANGSGELHYTSGNNGTGTSNGAKVTINFLGASCVFETKNTSIGTFTGGKPGTVDIGGTIPGVSGGLCPTSGIMSGNYTVTSPSGTLHAAAS